MKTQDYNFSLNKGVYTPLTNGTVWQSGTALNVDALTEVTLPAPFIFCGTAYAKATIYNNGFITFGKGLDNGSIMDANVKSPISNTVKGYAIDYIISGFGANLCANNDNSSISYGANSNDFVIQFSEMSILGSPQTKVSFQIVLGINGSVKIVYSDVAGQAGSISPQIGLRGKMELDVASGVYRLVNDYNNRKLLGAGDWNVIQPNSNLTGNSKGTMPSSAMAWKDITILPQSGLTFEWSI